jgi:ribosomal protein S18 acetylase RimI-like enzyme
MENEEVTLRLGAGSDVAALEPLWLAVHRHHQASMPELAPYVEDSVTWRVRRALYEELLRKPDTVLVLAAADDALVGYGLAHVMPAEGSWVADTWVTGERVGEIESLGVLAEQRGGGIGGRIFSALMDALEADGVRDVVIGALAGNASAIAFYERRGFSATWMYLSRFTKDS